MPQDILIEIDDEVLVRLQLRAEQKRQSLEDYVREEIIQAAGPGRELS